MDPLKIDNITRLYPQKIYIGSSDVISNYKSVVKLKDDLDFLMQLEAPSLDIYSTDSNLNINEISDWEIKVLNIFLDNNKQFIPRYKKNIMYFIRLMSHISRYEKTKDNNLRNQIIIEISANQYLNLFTRTLLKVFLKFIYFLNILIILQVPLVQ